MHFERTDSLKTMRKNIILAFDGSVAGLSVLLNTEKLTAWRDEYLLLTAIIPRPVQSCVYEPDFFNPSISVDEFEDIQNRLDEARGNLLAHGYKVSVKLGYLDSRTAVSQFLRDLDPDLVVTTLGTRKWRHSRWRKQSIASYVIETSPCETLIL